MRILLVHPGASWSTADVEAGLRYGLEQIDGLEIIRYRLDTRIDVQQRFLNTAWRRRRKQALKAGEPAPERPTRADAFYQAGVGVIEMALRHRVHVVLVVSGMFLHKDVLIMLRGCRWQDNSTPAPTWRDVRTFVLFTESPYDLQEELKVAPLVDGCWTNERSSIAAFRRANPRSGYVPHAWHPQRHQPGPQDSDELVPAHDVVFVGSAFQERIDWFQSIDWTGIDLGLYGNWRGLPARSPLRQFVRGPQVDNRTAAALYRRAKIGLNLYRKSIGWGKDAPQIAYAESLNPRAYELAACGVFHLSEYRKEVAEVFGDRVPTFTTPTEAAALIRRWLADDAGRARVAASLPACVAEATWAERATRVIGDLQSLLQPHLAAVG